MSGKIAGLLILFVIAKINLNTKTKCGSWFQN